MSDVFKESFKIGSADSGTSIPPNSGQGGSTDDFDARYLRQSLNLSDLNSVSTALGNLGLGVADTPNFTGLELGVQNTTTGTILFESEDSGLPRLRMRGYGLADDAAIFTESSSDQLLELINTGAGVLNVDIDGDLEARDITGVDLNLSGSIQSGSITSGFGNIDIGGSSFTGKSLTLNSGTSGDVLLTFDTDRNWQVEQFSDDATTELWLKSYDGGNKYFSIVSDGGLRLRNNAGTLGLSLSVNSSNNITTFTHPSGSFLRFEQVGGLTFNNTTAEGDVKFIMDFSNSFIIQNNGGIDIFNVDPTDEIATLSGDFFARDGTFTRDTFVGRDLEVDGDGLFHSDIELDGSLGDGFIGTDNYGVAGGSITGWRTDYSGNADFGGIVQIEDYLQSPDYVSGIFGDGYRLDNTLASGSFFEIDNMRVRKEFRTHIFKKDTVRSTNGLLYVSDASEVGEEKTFADTDTGVTLSIKAGDTYATFSVGNELTVRNVSPDFTAINHLEFEVTAVDTTDPDETILTVDVINSTSGTVYEGDTIVRTSGGTLLADATTEFSPFLDVMLDTDTKVRLGNLRGIGSLSLSEDRWGLYAKDNIFLDFGDSDIFSIGRDVGGTGLHGILLPNGDFWYGDGTGSLGGGVLTWDGDASQVKLADWTALGNTLSATGLDLVSGDNPRITGTNGGTIHFTPTGNQATLGGGYDNDSVTDFPFIGALFTPTGTSDRIYVNMGHIYEQNEWQDRFGFNIIRGKNTASLFEVSVDTSGNLTALVGGDFDVLGTLTIGTGGSIESETAGAYILDDDSVSFAGGILSADATDVTLANWTASGDELTATGLTLRSGTNPLIEGSVGAGVVSFAPVGNEATLGGGYNNDSVTDFPFVGVRYTPTGTTDRIYVNMGHIYENDAWQDRFGFNIIHGKATSSLFEVSTDTSGNLTAVIRDLDIDGELTMGSNGVITNSGGDYEISADGIEFAPPDTWSAADASVIRWLGSSSNAVFGSYGLTNPSLRLQANEIELYDGDGTNTFHQRMTSATDNVVELGWDAIEILSSLLPKNRTDAGSADRVYLVDQTDYWEIRIRK